ncbi:MAG: DUF2330 domain-containing protein [Phycisphaeraceae bacterium]
MTTIARRLFIAFAVFFSTSALADGKVFAPAVYEEKPYTGSLEEKAQEAIIIFHKGDDGQSARQDMILKIAVEGEVDQFAWVVPLPAVPETGKEDAAVFEELHGYVQARLAESSRRSLNDSKAEGDKEGAAEDAPQAVELISRKIVGSYDVSVVREKEAGTLNKWLKDNGYQPVPDAEDVIGFYREQGYVFACVKVAEAELKKGSAIEMHPLRFSFDTGGRDGIFFPMRMTGLQEAAFDVNLYVFYDKWVNDRLSKYGYAHRGFTLRWRDYDTKACKKNAGKTWSDPKGDPYLRAHADRLPETTGLFQKLHPGKRFYLTNLYAHGLEPDDVRDWAGDLWLFPYYTNRSFVPYDARKGGPAASVYE